MRATVLRGLMALAVLGGSAVGSGPSAQRAGAEVEPDKVLILSRTVSGGTSSIEAARALSLGFSVEIASDAQWSAKTADDFKTYRALILGDPTCSSSPSTVEAATANAATWGPAVNGNVILIGTDPVFHQWSGGRTLTEKGVDFATSQVGKTGAYITLSCYYHGAAAGTAVPLLDGIRPGAFTVRGVGCFDDAHIVATHPALEGLTDASLSNWSCSVHEAFDSWPADFAVLAMARGVGTSFTATDGTVGTPYILASGDGLASVGLSLNPSSATVPTGTTHTVTAQLLQGTTALADRRMVFGITAGPDTGVAGTCSTGPDCLTGADGRVSWTFTNAGIPGDNTVTAFADSNGNGVSDSGEPRTTALARVVEAPNSAPTFVDPTPADGAVLQATLGSEIRTTVKGSDPDADDVVTLAASGLPSGATFTLAGNNPAVGELAWTPTAVGDVTMTFTATDGRGLAAAPRTVSIHVNAPPAFLDPTPASAEVNLGRRLDFTVAASDANGEDTVNLGALGLPTGATFSPTPGNPASATFSWTPSTGSDATVTLRATDPRGLVTTHPVPIHVNDPPRFAAPTPPSGSTLPGHIDVGDDVHFTVRTTDVDGDTVEIVDIQGLTGASISRVGTTNEFDVTWPAKAPGTYSVVVLATDRPVGTAGAFVSRRSFKILVRTPTTLTGTPAVAEMPSATHYAEMVDGQPSFGVMVQGIWFGYLAAQLETQAGAPVAGRVVEFDVKGTKGLATTRADGWAVLEDLNLAMAAVQHGSYTATFAGDTLYGKSDDAPGLVAIPAPPPTG